MAIGPKDGSTEFRNGEAEAAFLSGLGGGGVGTAGIGAATDAETTGADVGAWGLEGTLMAPFTGVTDLDGARFSGKGGGGMEPFGPAGGGRVAAAVARTADFHDIFLRDMIFNYYEWFPKRKENEKHLESIVEFSTKYTPKEIT